MTTVFASISLLSFIGAAEFDPDKKLEDILENLDEEPNLQPVVKKEQKKSTGSPNFQNERLNFLINNFQTYMSKPFPNKYLNPNDPFFDDFYTTIARIKGYDFRCGYEKENQLLDKIKAHNEVILNKLEPTKTRSVIGVNPQTSIIANSVQKEDLRSHNLSTHALNSKQESDFQNESRFKEETLKSLIDNFEAYISKPFPNKHLSPDDLFLCDFYINRIKEYDSECGREKEKQLLDKIKAHNEIISNSTKANNPSSVIGFDSKTSKERLNSLIDSFDAYISKPFPDKHLNSNDSFFDDFYSLINRIKGYDFNCGQEKGRQLLEKIKTHNETIAISKTTSIQDEKLISLIKNFQSAMSRPFPDKYLSGKDSFFNDFYNMLDEIRNYDLNFSIINQKKLLEKIQLHNEKITGVKSDRDFFVQTGSVELEDDIDEILDGINCKFHPSDVLHVNKAEPPVVRMEPEVVIQKKARTEEGKIDTKSLINKFRDSISVQFPEKYLDIDESFF
ncbi:hypothetical protein II898_05215 [bacterium]|nr:hypothetical protein [bacterium]